MNFKHRDLLTDSLLNLPPNSVSSRRWFYYIPAQGTPLKLVHSIENKILHSLPGTTKEYTGLEELQRNLAALKNKKIAVLSDPKLHILSTFDASTWNFLKEQGLILFSAASLVQRTTGLLNNTLYQTHEKAAQILFSTIQIAWDTLCSSYKKSIPMYEKEIQNLILSIFKKEGLITDHPPIIAFGTATSDPHYSIPENSLGNKLEKNQVIQFDLWAKYPQGAYADISWIGYTATKIPKDIQKTFNFVIQARDLVLPAILQSIETNKSITGSYLDTLVRNFLLERVPPNAIKHRTGHGIDTECHGSGVNLDSIEFPDNRILLPGSCFSVEPGIYFSDYGMRTEINIYITKNNAFITGPTPQYTLLHL